MYEEIASSKSLFVMFTLFLNGFSLFSNDYTTPQFLLARQYFGWIALPGPRNWHMSPDSVCTLAGAWLGTRLCGYNYVTVLQMCLWQISNCFFLCSWKRQIWVDTDIFKIHFYMYTTVNFSYLMLFCAVVFASR